MTPEAITRAARQIALPSIGIDGQQRISSAVAVIAGDDVMCEIAARALTAAGVNHLRLVRRSGAFPAVITAALAASNPDVRVETRAWPTGDSAPAGAAWMDAINGADVVIRSGFDDDSMVRAAIRLGIPVVVTRGRDDGVDVVSFRKHGPCPHAPLDVATQPGRPPQDGPGAVIAGNLAATEALILIADAATGTARARHISVPMPTDDNVSRADSTGGDARASDIPWTPECFACGGSGLQMSFS